jgi:hypothetical protein
MSNKEIPPQRELFYQYCRLGTLSKVAEYYDTNTHWVTKWMEEYDIHRVRNSHPASALYHEEHLRKLYKEEQSVRGIRKRLPNNSSRTAVMKWLDKHEIETNYNHSTRGKKEKIECDFCGEKDIVYSHTLVDKENWFCNRSCYIKYRKNVPAEEHPCWKGENHNRKLYENNKFRKIRRKLREKENHTCQMCDKTHGEDSEHFHSHHMVPIREFDNFEDAHTLDNLALLCRWCHRKAEHNMSLEKQRQKFND